MSSPFVRARLQPCQKERLASNFRSRGLLARAFVIRATSLSVTAPQPVPRSRDFRYSFTSSFTTRSKGSHALVFHSIVLRYPSSSHDPDSLGFKTIRTVLRRHPTIRHPQRSVHERLAGPFASQRL